MALARQRPPAGFDSHKINDGGTGYQPVAAGDPPAASGPAGQVARSTPSLKSLTPNSGFGFVCKTVPHITLKSIAQNVALDAIFA